MKDRVMLDIETLGTDTGSAILSIGAVRFNREGLGSTLHVNISLESCQRLGLDIDAGTLEWWLQQDKAARDAAFGGSMDIGTALQRFNSFYGNADEVWANSPAFDCVMMEEAYSRTRISEPWGYKDTRDFRTLLNLPGFVSMEPEGTAHDALDDARHQARQVAATLRRYEDADEW